MFTRYSNLGSLKLKKLTKGENTGKVFIIMVKGGFVKKQEKWSAILYNNMPHGNILNLIHIPTKVDLNPNKIPLSTQLVDKNFRLFLSMVGEIKKWFHTLMMRL